MSESIDRAALIQELAGRRVSYSPQIARVSGGATAGILLCQLLWYAAGEDKWTQLRQIDIEEQTALTRREQEGARKDLRERGLLEERLVGMPAQLEYRVVIDRLVELLQCTKAPNKNGGNVQTSLDESAKQDCTKAPNKNGGNRQTLLDSGSDLEPDLQAERPEEDGPPLAPGWKAIEESTRPGEEPSPLAPDTDESRLFFERIQENLRLLQRKPGPARFGTIEQKQAFDQAVIILDGDFEQVLNRLLRKEILRRSNAVDYVVGAAALKTKEQGKSSEIPTLPDEKPIDFDEMHRLFGDLFFAEEVR